MNITKLSGLIISFLLISCAKDDKKENKIANIDVDVKVERFDLAFGQASPDDLPQLKRAYPYLFPEQFPDSVWVGRMTDTIQQELFQEVKNAFPDFTKETTELKSLFQHAIYYFPDFQVPEIVTLTSDVDYQNKVVYADTIMLVALDTYLGKEHRFYVGIQKYIRENFEKDQIVSDAASAIAKRYMQRLNERTFLAHMVQEGKELYLKDLLIPFQTEAQRIGYTSDQYNWVVANENEIWRYFVEKDLIFSTDSKLADRFLNPAPFSKFYLELDQESPGRVGRFIGWQLVRSYMNNNDVSLQTLLAASPEEIFNSARYKPKK